MFTESPSLRILSNNGLKVIAAVIMVIDHMGVLIFPEVIAFRIIGRIGFPIFAFLIAEGAKHTRNKLRHLVVMGGFAAVIQIVYFIATGSQEMNVLITFSLSLLIIYALDHLKNTVFGEIRSTKNTVIASLLLIGAVLLAIVSSAIFDLDYGLWGCMLPAFPALFTTPKVPSPLNIFKTFDTKTFRVLAIGFGTLLLAIDTMMTSQFYGLIQLVALLSIPILLLYSEKRGKLKMKYFFYIFYPLHLVVLQGIALLIK